MSGSTAVVQDEVQEERFREGDARLQLFAVQLPALPRLRESTEVVQDEVQDERFKTQRPGLWFLVSTGYEP